MRIEWTGLWRQRRLARNGLTVQRPGHRRHAVGRGRENFAVTPALAPLAKIPNQMAAPGNRPAQSKTLGFEKVGELRQVDVAIRDVPGGVCRHTALVERGQLVVEP